MAAPRVFISSTWYDLRYIRENLRYFVRTIGYEPVLSEDGSIFYNPRLHVQDACIAEIPNCQMFILIIGGKRGSSFKSSDKSVTNTEYDEAVRLNIPIFALVENSVLSEFYLYEANRDNALVDTSALTYPSADNTSIFDFIRSVRAKTLNNSLVSFHDFADIETYLRQQWAAMMLAFLSARNEADRVSDTLSMLTTISERIENMSRQILESVGTRAAKLNAKMYDIMLMHECIRDIAYMGGRVTPLMVVQATDFVTCCELSGVTLNVEEGREVSSVGQHGFISSLRLDADIKGYANVRSALLRRLKVSGLSEDQFVNELAGSVSATDQSVEPQ